MRMDDLRLPDQYEITRIILPLKSTLTLRHLAQRRVLLLKKRAKYVVPF